ncbi:TetR/AcrR family transcriptional regulator [Streptosporangium carneum]|uniref:TetR/AcrR family transcriptional regulator n=1 Tax=Streptosporangium carneum TaxID=47481 RepID=UPI0022F32316|nr:TetR/AcrR family transcriptional regulator [Streptosporangium carneum]
MISTSPRAAPLPPDERRAALIASTLALVLAQGPDVNTKQIAQAAGVAEGTIFRVFATKDELVNAAISSAFDPSPLLHDLTAVDRAASLDARLVAAVEILQRHTACVFRLVDALVMRRAAATGRKAQTGRDAAETGVETGVDGGPGPGQGDPEACRDHGVLPDSRAAELQRIRATQLDQRVVIRQALVNLIEPDRDRLRCTPQETARRLQLLTIAGSHPRIVEDDPLTPEEIVSTLLDGIRLRPGHDTPAPASPRDASHPEAPVLDLPDSGTPGLDTPSGDPPC